VPRYLRAGIKKDNWFAPGWLGAGQIPASALGDLKAPDNELSFYEVPDDTFVERISVAFAATRDRVDKLGYVVFDGTPLTAVGLRMVSTPGDTPDTVVNGLHHDLKQLTGQNLLDLALVLMRGIRDDILPKQLTKLLQDGVDQGRLDKSKMKDKLLKEIGRV
jgi:hypothetical protein